MWVSGGLSLLLCEAFFDSPCSYLCLLFLCYDTLTLRNKSDAALVVSLWLPKRKLVDTAESPPEEGLAAAEM